MPTPHHQAVIFDHDGVLVDSEPLHRVAWEQTFRPKGIRVSDEDYEWSIGRRDQIFADLVGRKYSVAFSPAEIVDEKRCHLQRLLATESNTFPGVPELVSRLFGTHRLGIASSAMRADIDITLRRFQLEKYFPVVIGGEDVARHKPDPEPYLLCAHRLGVEPANCVVLEDSITGIQSGKAAGMHVIGVATTFPAGRIQGADIVLTGLADTGHVLGIIQSLLT